MDLEADRAIATIEAKVHVSEITHSIKKGVEDAQRDFKRIGEYWDQEQKFLSKQPFYS